MNTNFINGGAPIDESWLNDVNFVIYDLLGNGTVVPANRGELLANIGAGSGGGSGGSGNHTFQQESAPSSPSIGDLWQVPSTGIMSRWDGTNWIVFGDIAGPAAATAASEAAAALAAATSAAAIAAAANTAITSIASDNVLSSGEKSAVILDYNNLINEQTGIDNQATAFSITAEKSAYDSAIGSLTSYLTSLTTPTAWNNVAGDTTIVGTTFRTTFAATYTARQILLNKIASVAKAIADSGVANAATAASAAASAAAAAASALAAANAAQSSANAAATNASNALSQLTNIGSDNILSSGEKPAVILDYTNLTGEQSGIDAQASAYAITTQRTNYDSAISALTSYLGGLTTPTAWNSITGDTTIVGSTFRTEFAAVYASRQAVLNEIARVAGTIATWAGVSGVSVTTGQIAPNAVTNAIGAILSSDVVNPNNTSENTLFTVGSIDTLGNPLQINAILDCKSVAPSAYVDFVIKIKVGSTTIWSATWVAIGGGYTAQQILTASVVYTPPSGSQSVYVTLQADSSSTTTFTLRGPSAGSSGTSISVIALKR